MAHTGDVGAAIAPEVAGDPELAPRLDDLLHRTCHLARALTAAEQAAFKVDLDGDGHGHAQVLQPSASSGTSAGAATAWIRGDSGCTAWTRPRARWCG
jgi:hypothetical protein